ncbi:polymer-forming cytoskeletal protein [Haloarcula brevis]|uniref:polymer-forming cytoskeletal protein n=1 Tax=Haloarcula brevis TaxID=3111453 RepID=UPI00300F1A23
MQRLRGTQRAQSAPLGLILVLSLVVVGSAVVVGLGATALSDTESGLDVSRAETGMTQFDSQAALVALGSSESQQVSLVGTDAATYRLDEDAGRMTVNITNHSASPPTTVTLLDEQLGAVVYENGNQEVAYQGGGVWRRSDSGSVMVSPPEFYYRDATLTLPLITVRGDRSLGSRASISKDGTTQVYPDRAAGKANPLDSGTVNVTVRSQYYRSWGRYFEERTDGDAHYDHADNSVTTTLVVPTGPRQVTSAVAATSAGGEISLSGSGTSPARTDSYNSSLGSYSATRGSFGTITTAGDVYVKGNSEVNGSIRSGERVEVKGSGVVTRDVEYSTTKHIKGTVDGEVRQISGVEGAGAIDGLVTRTVANASSTNDNGATSSISGAQLLSGDQTLDAGTYYLEDLTLSGETLTINTGGDDVTIAVRDYVYIENNGRIEVNGDGEVRFYVKGETTSASGHHFHIYRTGAVDVDTAQNATQFWLYGQSDFDAAIEGDTDTPQFEGVIYAPAGGVGASNVYVQKAELYGGLVAGSVEVDNGGLVHYDRSLKNVRAVPKDTNIIRLTYLHVSKNRLNVTSG